MPGPSMRIEDAIARGGATDVPVRVYTPAGRAVAGLVWAHGGAFVAGGLDDPEADQVARRLAADGIAVVSVDYRLAPLPPAWAAEAGLEPHAGVHFPLPVDDVVAALRWARSRPGADRIPWSLGGASAGAALAASAGLRLRDDGDPPHALVLAYPVVHAELPPAPEGRERELAAVPAHRRFPPETVRRMSSNYLGAGTGTRPPHAFAGESALESLPPVLIVDSELDDLRASGEAFAADLIRAGVDVHRVCERGALHGHLNDLDDPLALRSIARISRWLTRVGSTGAARTDPIRAARRTTP
jgi:acetyl esterase